MPLSTEVIPNRALSGTELIEIVCNDVRSAMQKDGLFSHYVAYGRIGYTITLQFNFDNPMMQDHDVRPRKTDPRIEEPPIEDPSEEESVVGIMRHREISNPNIARVHNDLPILVQTHVGQNLKNEEIRYEKEGLPEPPPPTDVDITKQTQAKWQRPKRIVAKEYRDD